MESTPTTSLDFKQAEFFRQMGKDEQAIEFYRKTLSNFPKHTEAMYQLAELLKNQGQTKEAASLYQRIVSTDPQHVAAYLNLGNLLFDQQPEEAIKQYLKCVEINPEYKQAYFNLGLAFEKIDQQQSITYFLKTTELDPSYTDAYYNLGRLYSETDPQKAIACFEKTIRLDPSHAYAYYSLGRLYTKTDEARAIAFYKKAIHLFEGAGDLQATHAYAYYGWGNVLFKQGKYEDAIEKYSKCAELAPTFKDTYYALGLCYEKTDKQKAIFYYRKTVELDKNNLNAFHAWGNVLLDMKDYQGAVSKYRECLRIDPQYRWAYYNLGLAFETLDQQQSIYYYSQAARIFEEQNDQGDFHAYAYYGWGRMLQQLGKAEEALEKFSKCIALSPRQSWGYEGYYQCMVKLKDSTPYIEELTGMAEENQSEYGFWVLGNLYNYVYRQYDKSLAYYEQSLAVNAGLRDVYVDLFNLYVSTCALPKAIEVLDQALAIDPEYTFAAHSKADYLFKMGEYEKSRTMWENVLILYEKDFVRFSGKKRESDAPPPVNESASNSSSEGNVDFTEEARYYYNYGFIYQEVFGNFQLAEENFRKGLALDPYNIHLLAALSKLYVETGRRALVPDIHHFWQRQANLNTIEALLKSYPGYSKGYFLLAELYQKEEQYDKARQLIKDHLQSEQEARVFNLQGLIAMGEEQYAKAIPFFRQAECLECYDLTYKNNLAKACLKSKNLEKAEAEFKSILKADANNVEAMIGLGELYLERAAQRDHDEDMLALSQQYFQQAVFLGKTRKGSKQLNLFEHRNRLYKDLELSDLYYSLGYIKTKQFEKEKLSFNKSLAHEALRCFTACCECNPDHFKAERAKNKIEKLLEAKRENTLLDRTASWLVAGLALLLLILCQFAFFSTGEQTATYAFSPANLPLIEHVISLEEDQQQALQSLAGVPFESPEALLFSLEKILGEENFAANQMILQNIDLSLPPTADEGARISAGYYALISFGCLMFIIASFYLSKLLKLKVGVIEIEKNAPSEVHQATSLGIQR